jgi:hypothetical protein
MRSSSRVTCQLSHLLLFQPLRGVIFAAVTVTKLSLLLPRLKISKRQHATTGHYSRAAAADNVVPEPDPALPPTPRPLPVPLAPAPTPGPLVDTPLADTCNTVSPPAKRTRKAKRRCEVELLRSEDEDGELHLSPISCEPRSYLTHRQHRRRR